MGALRTHFPTRWPGLVVLAAALAVVPTRLAAFAEPKTLVLAAAAVVSLARALGAKRTAAALVPSLLFAAATVASSLAGDGVLPGALALQLAGAGLLVAWSLTGVDVARVAPLVAAAGTLVAAVAVAQAVGADPLAAFSPDGGGTRLAVYGTLGNPDFVAGFVAPALALSLALRPRATRWRVALGLAVALQGGALVAARSFGTLLALAAAAAAVLGHAVRWSGGAGAPTGPARAETAPPVQPERVGPLLRPPLPAEAGEGGPSPRPSPRRGGERERWSAEGPLARRRALVLVAVALLGAVWLAPRDATRALEGRLYLWQVALPHLREAPLLGHGPGAVQALWGQWEADAWAAGRVDASARRFAAAQDHLHSDVLERLLEGGLLGLLALGALLAAALRSSLGAPGPLAAGVAAALAALAARAAVDFPLARPAELGLFVLLCAAASCLSPAAREESRT